MIYATSDLHGISLREFRKLLDMADFSDSDYLFILGDVIDRNGDGGIEVLQWIMEQPNIQLLMGNHEAMMLSCSFIFDEITDLSIEEMNEENIELLTQWICNGAEPTIKALQTLRKKDPDAVNAIVEFIKELPMYDHVETDVGDFLLVHGGLGNFSPEKRIRDYSCDELVWYRPEPDERFFDDITLVLGHTPTTYYQCPERMFRTETWIDIDTGAAVGGKPMLLRLDDMKEFYMTE